MLGAHGEVRAHLDIVHATPDLLIVVRMESQELFYDILLILILEFIPCYVPGSSNRINLLTKSWCIIVLVTQVKKQFLTEKYNIDYDLLTKK